MTDKEYNRLVELRNKCYRDRRDRETDITYFTGFNDGYEKGKESFEKENAESKCECRTCVYTDSPCVRSDYPSKDGVCDHYKNVFEENAEQYTENPKSAWKQGMTCVGSVRQAFKDGAEFGYNKANEWHYVKDGLPKDNEYVLIYTDLNNCYVAKKVENHFMSKGWGFIPMSTVIAWKEIVPPELKESR